MMLAAAWPVIYTRTAHAKDYQMTESQITAQLVADGSLQVSEARTFAFEGDYSYVYWDLEHDGQAAPLISGATWAQDGGDPTRLSDADSATDRNEFFEVEERGSTTRVTLHHRASDTQVCYTLSYTLPAGAVERHEDAAQLYWKAVGDGWDLELGALRVTVLPPEGSALTKADVRAWAHGPLWGNVAIANDGTVTLTVDSLPAQTFVEVRALYPADAFATAPLVDGLIEPTVLAEEQQLADEANAERAAARDAQAREEARERRIFWIVTVVGAVFSVGTAAGLWLMFRKYGREYRVAPAYVGKYWREDPRPDLSPAVIGAMMRMGRVETRDMTACLMSLTDSGAVRMQQVDIPQTGLFGREKKPKRELLFSRVSGAAIVDDVDAAAADFLFAAAREYALPDGTLRAFTFDDLKDYAQDHPNRYVEDFKDWKRTAGAAAEARGFIDTTSKTMKVFAFALCVLPLLAMMATFTVGSIVVFVLSLVSLVACALFAAAMNRRTREGAELYAYYKGLRNYLRDFSRLNEAPPTSVIIWRRFLVLATVFGIADEVARQLKVTLPQVVNDPAFGPSWWWFYGGIYHHAPATMFNTALASAHSAAAAEIAKTASSSSSSGGGFGGGFTGGGGGGFGGGGGGAG
jgi:uncharacterized membrane protein